MKVIIDLIEDIREEISNEKSFALVVMALEEQGSGEFLPSWESPVAGIKIDDEAQRLFVFLGKEQSLSVGSLLQSVNDLPNKAMMHEVLVSYSKDARRVDSSLLGFGESREEKKYILFIREQQ